MFKKASPLFSPKSKLLMITFILAFTVYALIILAALTYAAGLGIAWLRAGGASGWFGRGGKFPARFRLLTGGEIMMSLGIAAIGIVALTWIDSRQKKKCPDPTPVPTLLAAGSFGNNGTSPTQTLPETRPLI